MSGWRLLVLTALAGVLAVLVGCLDFEEQRARIEYDQQNDRLIFIIDYRGLYEDGADTEEGERQLSEAIDNETVALLGHWPFAFELKTLRAQLEEPDEDLQEEVPLELRQDALTFLERVRVLNAGFYTDPGGRVCGTQVVTIEKARDSIRLVNSMVNRAILFGAQKQDPELPPQMVESARNDHTWVRLKGNSLVVTFPVTEEEFQEGRRDLVEEVLEALEGDDRDIRLPVLKDVLSSPVLVWHEDGMMKVKCGLQTRPSLLVLKPRTGDYKPNLVEHISRTHGLGLDDNLARYLLTPEAPAQTQAEQAARIIAPRLTKLERIRVLVRRLTREPGPEHWAMLREEPAARGMGIPAQASDAELLELWRQWLKARAPVPHQPEAEPEN